MITRRFASACCFSVLAAAVASKADAQDQFRQRAVDDLVARIGAALEASLETADWRPKYDQALRNIEDLRNTLRYGGRINSNPVAALQRQLDALWDERRSWLEFLQERLAELQRLSAEASEQGVRDVGAAMLRFLASPVPGPGQAVSMAFSLRQREQIGETLRRDFEQVRTAEQAIKVTRGYIEELLKNMEDLKARRTALVPVSEAFGALPGAEEKRVFTGKFTWRRSGASKASEGAISLTVSGEHVLGTMTVTISDTTRATAAIKGQVDKNGRLVAQINGSSAWQGKGTEGMTAVIMKSLSSFPFKGTLSGTIAGVLAKGSYQAQSQDQRTNVIQLSGDWEAKRQ